MPMKVKSCHVCWKAWTLEQWRGLPLLETYDDGAERRRCPCGTEEILDVAHFERLDLRLPMEVAMTKLATAKRRRLRARWSLAMWLVCAVALVVVATAMALRVQW